ncbi:hypothetical protein LNKW23_29520 [Paralimibaculum aggregatum]|uniref:Class I SAM-dependent methyltransferase n=1 Tax=Paralimibaculum aggregatum TaxID=3036245 RepID=A0ABQ6LN44_9RHOB|nr:class I SAM-dependent methyltransferase [Limibaculum sp. NKW23]GMG83739.1 hypothetical protein LNKW23_29520 [Limibaculum sp. NKW23]
MSRFAERREARRAAALAVAMAALGTEVDAICAELGRRPTARDLARVAEARRRLPSLVQALRQASGYLRRDNPEAPLRHRAALGRARATIASARHLCAGLDRLLAHAPIPLMPPEVSDCLADRRGEVIGRAFRGLEQAINGPGQAEALAGAVFPYIPYPPARFTAFLQAAWRVLAVLGRAEGARFLEIGAGAGAKQLIAAQFFPAPEGIELDAGYLARAGQLAAQAPEGARLFAADATRFDRYGDYDVIYAYFPLRESAAESALEREIHRQMRHGSVALMPYVRQTFIHEIEQIAPGVVVKGYAGAELAALRRDAELIGPAVPPLPEHATLVERDRCAPARAALRRNGFTPHAL